MTGWFPLLDEEENQENAKYRELQKQGSQTVKDRENVRQENMRQENKWQENKYQKNQDDL